jgi:hypothetical protein
MKNRKRRRKEALRPKAKTLVEVFKEEKAKALLAEIERKSALGEIK